MSCPKLYFFFNKATRMFVPISSQAHMDPITNDKDIKVNYNSYTNMFIEEHADTLDDFVWSDDYTYNPETHAFNFNHLVICNEDEYINIATYTCQFDCNASYGEGGAVSVAGTLLDDIRTQNPCPSIADCGFHIDAKNWLFLLRNIKRKKNTMLVGPTGTGKTELIRKVCEAIGMPLKIYDMGSMQDPLTDLLGSHRLENGSSVFDYSQFSKDIQEPGVILLDELSRAPQQANNILFPCLDGRRSLPVQIADSKSERNIPVHPDCVFIATANIGEEYSGTETIDAALMNRFLCVKLDYLSAAEEETVLTTVTGISAKDAKAIVTLANDARTAYANGFLSKPISTRETVACAEMIVDGFDRWTACQYAFIQKFTEEEEERKMREIVMGH